MALSNKIPSNKVFQCIWLCNKIAPQVSDMNRTSVVVGCVGEAFGEVTGG